jgi:hypothetical protein
MPDEQLDQTIADRLAAALTVHEWKVSWRRGSGRDTSARTYQTAAGAYRFAALLLSTPRWKDSQPIAEVTVQRRPVGAWQALDVFSLDGKRGEQ